MSGPGFRRILLKFSGEILAREDGGGIDFAKLSSFCKQIAEVRAMGTPERGQKKLCLGSASLIGNGPLARHDRARTRQQPTSRHVANRYEDANKHDELDAISDP